MSPALHDQNNAKSNNNNKNNNANNSLKINKDSHMIKKSSSSSLSSPPSSSSFFSASSGGTTSKLPPQPQRHHPVIIYTHSPRIIKTNPKDFMELVQKLTGLSRSTSDHGDGHHQHQLKQEKGNNSSGHHDREENNYKNNGKMDDNESSSVITDENSGGSINGDNGQVNSSFVPPIFEPAAPNPYNITNIPVFTPNTEFLCASHQPLYNYTDSLFFATPPNIRTTSISSSPSSTLEGITEFREY